jgi:hypothetical protein
LGAAEWTSGSYPACGSTPSCSSEVEVEGEKAEEEEEEEEEEVCHCQELSMRP